MQCLFNDNSYWYKWFMTIDNIANDAVTDDLQDNTLDEEFYNDLVNNLISDV